MTPAHTDVMEDSVGPAEEIYGSEYKHFLDILFIHLSLFKNNPRHLRALCRAPRTADASDVPVPARFGLVNARSLANKTFILRDFFMSRGLDFLCLTETWLSAGESTPLIELLPPDCCYFNSPRSSGRKGGGIAVVFNSGFKCRQIRVQQGLYK